VVVLVCINIAMYWVVTRYPCGDDNVWLLILFGNQAAVGVLIATGNTVMDCS